MTATTKRLVGPQTLPAFLYSIAICYKTVEFSYSTRTRTVYWLSSQRLSGCLRVGDSPVARDWLESRCFQERFSVSEVVSKMFSKMDFQILPFRWVFGVLKLFGGLPFNRNDCPAR